MDDERFAERQHRHWLSQQLFQESWKSRPFAAGLLAAEADSSKATQAFRQGIGKRGRRVSSGIWPGDQPQRVTADCTTAILQAGSIDIGADLVAPRRQYRRRAYASVSPRRARHYSALAPVFLGFLFMGYMLAILQKPL